MTPRLKKTNILKKMADELTVLRARLVEQEIFSTAKDEAMRDYVNHRIAKINQAIRATNGPVRGESMQSYRGRIVSANA